MGKVIDIYTGREFNQQLPTKEEGEALLKAVMTWELDNTNFGSGPQSLLILNILQMIEVNTGASRLDVFDEVYLRKS